MSIVSELSTAAIQVINAGEATPIVEYSSAASGPWTNLDPDGGGVVFHYKQSDGSYMDSGAAEGSDRSARVTVRDGLTVLAVGQFIRRAADDNDIWAIISGPEGTTSRAYELQRQEVQAFKPDRGRFG